MAMMKAVRIHAYGGPEVLVYEEAPRPGCNADDVLIEVHAAGVNPVDWKIREGHFQEMLPRSLPFIPGWDVAGTIVEKGGRVKGLRLQDRVYALASIARDGAYAEYIAVKGTEVALSPESLDFEHAAAVPLAALTAWQCLFPTAGLGAGQKILIHGAAGGVGHFAVQFARWAGAHVIGTASARNHDFLRGLGAHEVIDYAAAPFEQAVRDVDVVLDTQGGEIWNRSWQVLKAGGLMVSTLHAPPAEGLEAAAGKRGAFVFVQPDAAQLAEIAALIDSGRVAPALERLFPLREAAAAQSHSQAGHARGKIVLRVKG